MHYQNNSIAKKYLKRSQEKKAQLKKEKELFQKQLKEQNKLRFRKEKEYNKKYGHVTHSYKIEYHNLNPVTIDKLNKRIEKLKLLHTWTENQKELYRQYDDVKDFVKTYYINRGIDLERDIEEVKRILNINNDGVIWYYYQLLTIDYIKDSIELYNLSLGVKSRRIKQVMSVPEGLEFLL